MAKRVVLELGASTNFVYSLRAVEQIDCPFSCLRAEKSYSVYSW